MGSWNDEWVEGEDATREYEEISRVLYAAVLDGLMASVDGDLARVSFSAT